MSGAAPPSSAVTQGESAVPNEGTSSANDRLEFPRPPSLGRDYWLARCEGYRVDAPEGRVGRVEEVRFGARHDSPDSIGVRVGLFRQRLLIVPVQEVDEILPREQRVTLRHSPLGPPRRGDVAQRLRRRKRPGSGNPPQ